MTLPTPTDPSIATLSARQVQSAQQSDNRHLPEVYARIGFAYQTSPRAVAHNPRHRRLDILRHG